VSSRTARHPVRRATPVPELPEVEVVRLGLAPAVTGAVVQAVEVHDERSLRRHPGTPLDFVSKLEGRTLRAPSRRGKFLWMPIEGASSALVGHLGMSGQMLLRSLDAPPDRHTRVRMRLAGPAGEYYVVFVDQRVFGSLSVDELVAVPDAHRSARAAAERVPASVAHIARDPLDPEFDDDAFVAGLRRRRTSVKAALLDQGLISGVGNIYADETLWMSRLSPLQLGETISTRKARELLANARSVFAKALAEGGTSFDSQYVNVNGQAGYFAHSLNAYGRHGEPCPRCGRPIVREAFQNRGSHFCPRCQRVRR